MYNNSNNNKKISIYFIFIISIAIFNIKCGVLQTKNGKKNDLSNKIRNKFENYGTSNRVKAIEAALISKLDGHFDEKREEEITEVLTNKILAAIDKIDSNQLTPMDPNDRSKGIENEKKLLLKRVDGIIDPKENSLQNLYNQIDTKFQNYGDSNRIKAIKDELISKLKGHFHKKREEEITKVMTNKILAAIDKIDSTQLTPIDKEDAKNGGIKQQKKLLLATVENIIAPKEIIPQLEGEKDNESDEDTDDEKSINQGENNLKIELLDELFKESRDEFMNHRIRFCIDPKVESKEVYIQRFKEVTEQARSLLKIKLSKYKIDKMLQLDRFYLRHMLSGCLKEAKKIIISLESKYTNDVIKRIFDKNNFDGHAKELVGMVNNEISNEFLYKFLNLDSQTKGVKERADNTEKYLANTFVEMWISGLKKKNIELNKNQKLILLDQIYKYFDNTYGIEIEYLRDELACLQPNEEGQVFYEDSDLLLGVTNLVDFTETLKITIDKGQENSKDINVKFDKKLQRNLDDINKQELVKVKNHKKFIRILDLHEKTKLEAECKKKEIGYLNKRYNIKDEHKKRIYNSIINYFKKKSENLKLLKNNIDPTKLLDSKLYKDICEYYKNTNELNKIFIDRNDFRKKIKENESIVLKNIKYIFESLLLCRTTILKNYLIDKKAIEIFSHSKFYEGTSKYDLPEFLGLKTKIRTKLISLNKQIIENIQNDNPFDDFGDQTVISHGEKKFYLNPLSFSIIDITNSKYYDDLKKPIEKAAMKIILKIEDSSFVYFSGDCFKKTLHVKVSETKDKFPNKLFPLPLSTKFETILFLSNFSNEELKQFKKNEQFSKQFSTWEEVCTNLKGIEKFVPTINLVKEENINDVLTKNIPSSARNDNRTVKLKDSLDYCMIGCTGKYFFCSTSQCQNEVCSSNICTECCYRLQKIKFDNFIKRTNHNSLCNYGKSCINKENPCENCKLFLRSVSSITDDGKTLYTSSCPICKNFLRIDINLDNAIPIHIKSNDSNIYDYPNYDVEILIGYGATGLEISKLNNLLYKFDKSWIQFLTSRSWIDDNFKYENIKKIDNQSISSDFWWKGKNFIEQDNYQTKPKAKITLKSVTVKNTTKLIPQLHLPVFADDRYFKTTFAKILENCLPSNKILDTEVIKMKYNSFEKCFPNVINKEKITAKDIHTLNTILTWKGKYTGIAKKAKIFYNEPFTISKNDNKYVIFPTNSFKSYLDSYKDRSIKQLMYLYREVLKQDNFTIDLSSIISIPSTNQGKLNKVSVLISRPFFEGVIKSYWDRFYNLYNEFSKVQILRFASNKHSKITAKHLCYDESLRYIKNYKTKETYSLPQKDIFNIVIKHSKKIAKHENQWLKEIFNTDSGKEYISVPRSASKFLRSRYTNYELNLIQYELIRNSLFFSKKFDKYEQKLTREVNFKNPRKIYNFNNIYILSKPKYTDIIQSIKIPKFKNIINEYAHYSKLYEELDLLVSLIQEGTKYQNYIYEPPLLEFVKINNDSATIKKYLQYAYLIINFYNKMSNFISVQKTHITGYLLKEKTIDRLKKGIRYITTTDGIMDYLKLRKNKLFLGELLEASDPRILAFNNVYLSSKPYFKHKKLYNIKDYNHRDWPEIDNPSYLPFDFLEDIFFYNLENLIYFKHFCRHINYMNLERILKKTSLNRCPGTGYKSEQVHFFRKNFNLYVESYDNMIFELIRFNRNDNQDFINNLSKLNNISNIKPINKLALSIADNNKNIKNEIYNEDDDYEYEYDNYLTDILSPVISTEENIKNSFSGLIDIASDEAPLNIPNIDDFI